MNDAPHLPAHPPSTEEEIALLREGLWQCYAIAGGDPRQYADEPVDSAELVSLVVDCVRDLRGFFDAARRDMRG